MATTSTTPGRRPTPAALAKSPVAQNSTRPARQKAVAQSQLPAQTVVEIPAVAREKPAKIKAKLVRDSFTMPQADFDLIGQLKEKALGFKRPTKKSELLRAGLQALDALGPQALRKALEQLTPLKPGRPKK